jgi:hypothetical protein
LTWQRLAPTCTTARLTGLQFQIADNNGGSYATGGVLNGGDNLFIDQDAAGTTHHHDHRQLRVADNRW